MNTVRRDVPGTRHRKVLHSFIPAARGQTILSVRGRSQSNVGAVGRIAGLDDLAIDRAISKLAPAASPAAEQSSKRDVGSRLELCRGGADGNLGHGGGDVNFGQRVGEYPLESLQPEYLLKFA